ncbi:hypothetical protein WR25_12803 [Diploscapter pachys]|uniref:Uncharacterized protein n=1 Tax=Diploscapter pachys TaxID=2018661 RepID=A0A2A2LH06_9BILA|nr:hypothetical protein WR25_12803 [Diploscapter pachys]
MPRFFTANQFICGALIVYLLISADNYDVVERRYLKDGSILKSIAERETELPKLPEEDEEIELDDKRIGLIVGDDKVLVPVDEDGQIVNEFKYLIEPVYYNIRAEDIRNSIVSDEQELNNLLNEESMKSDLDKSKKADGIIPVGYPDEKKSEQVSDSPLVVPKSEDSEKSGISSDQKKTDDDGLEVLERTNEVDESDTISQIDRNSAEKAIEQEKLTENGEIVIPGPDKPDSEASKAQQNSDTSPEAPKLPPVKDYQDSQSEDDKEPEKIDMKDEKIDNQVGGAEKEGMQKENAEGREEIEEELNEEDIKSAASELIGKIKENVKNKAEDFGDLQNIFKFEEESDKPDSEEDDEKDLGSGKSAEWESGSNTVKDKKPSPGSDFS